MDTPHTGTTIVAMTYRDGVVLGADSRVSTGTYVSNRASDKITQLADNVYLLRSGSAADTQLVADYVRYFTEQHSLDLDGRRPLVKTVANLVMQVNYQNKQLIGAMIVAGFDDEGGAQVYGCPIGGTLVKDLDWTTDGSGSTYLWGFLDDAYTSRKQLSRSEAEDLVAEAVGLAMARDGSSGGLVRLVTVESTGAHRRLVSPREVASSWDEDVNIGADTSMQTVTV